MLPDGCCCASSADASNTCWITSFRPANNSSNQTRCQHERYHEPDL